ncbi:MAG: nitrate reductase [Thermodesulfobacteriota bacterium]|nr:nitrate reductase [Thermodesulfobacteriota bacterium]
MNTPDTFSVLFDFVSGPLLWATVIVFIAGTIYRIGNLFWLANRREPFVYTYLSLTAILRSLAHWLVPFGTTSWRQHPALTVVTFVFHICLVLLPIFLTAHVVMLNVAWGIDWPTLPAAVADVLTLVVIACCAFFLVRRITQPEVRYLTTPSDYVLLGIAAAPFITGFLAYHQWAGYNFWLILHILTGELMLVAIPFTRLTHMLLALFTRSYLASEFGGVRMARDW